MCFMAEADRRLSAAVERTAQALAARGFHAGGVAGGQLQVSRGRHRFCLHSSAVAGPADHGARVAELFAGLVVRALARDRAGD